MNIFEFLKNLLGEKSTGIVEDPRDAELEKLKKNCWIPIIEEGDGAITASKFAGIPYFPPGETWPICPNCENPMQLFLQLNHQTLPKECEKIWGEGLLQFFYCTSEEPFCEGECNAFFPFAKSTLLRILSPTHSESIYAVSPVRNAFPPKRIKGWQKMDDLPNWEELRENGLEFRDHKYDELSEIYPRAGDKLLGWPMWIQGLEYPNCPQCDSRMRLVFQIDSENNVPFMFGDVGCGHITQCPNHLKELAFGWACG